MLDVCLNINKEIKLNCWYCMIERERKRERSERERSERERERER